MAAGPYHACAIEQRGAVQCWGALDRVPDELAFGGGFGAVGIACTLGEACAIVKNRAAWVPDRLLCWDSRYNTRWVETVDNVEPGKVWGWASAHCFQDRFGGPINCYRHMRCIKDTRLGTEACARGYTCPEYLEPWETCEDGWYLDTGISTLRGVSAIALGRASAAALLSGDGRMAGTYTAEATAEERAGTFTPAPAAGCGGRYLTTTTAAAAAAGDHACALEVFARDFPAQHAAGSAQGTNVRCWGVDASKQPVVPANFGAATALAQGYSDSFKCAIVTPPPRR